MIKKVIDLDTWRTRRVSSGTKAYSHNLTPEHRAQEIFNHMIEAVKDLILDGSFNNFQKIQNATNSLFQDESSTEYKSQVITFSKSQYIYYKLLTSV